MTTLTALMDLVGTHLDETPAGDQRAWIDGTDPVVLQAMLERTCVIRRLPDGAHPRELVAKERVYVDAETLRWVPTGPMLWDSLNGPTRPGSPTMRERRLRGRQNAERNKRRRFCKVCEQERSGQDLARYRGLVCGACKNERLRAAAVAQEGPSGSKAGQRPPVSASVGK